MHDHGKQTMKTRLPGLIVFLIGLNIVTFVFSGQYWTLLNPKYIAVTATVGFSFGGIGLLLLVRPARFQRTTFLSAIVIFLLLSALNVSLFLKPQVGSSELDINERLDRLYSREIKRDTEYIKINIAELTSLVDSKSPQLETESYLFRGQIYRLDEKAAIVQRTTVACCLADAVSIGFKVISEKPITFEDEQWVKVYGQVLETATQELITSPIKYPTGFMTVINQEVTIQADAIELSQQPDFPLIFNIQDKEPFAY